MKTHECDNRDCTEVAIWRVTDEDDFDHDNSMYYCRAHCPEDGDMSPYMIARIWA